MTRISNFFYHLIDRVIILFLEARQCYKILTTSSSMEALNIYKEYEIIAFSHRYHHISWKRYEIGPLLLWITDRRKS